MLLPELKLLNDKTPVTVASGCMGNPDKWCYWETEYPDEGFIGPFDSKQKAIEHAEGHGFVIEGG